MLNGFVIDDIHLTIVQVSEITKHPVMDFQATWFEIVQALETEKSIGLTALHRMIALEASVFAYSLNILG